VALDEWQCDERGYPGPENIYKLTKDQSSWKIKRNAFICDL